MAFDHVPNRSGHFYQCDRTRICLVSWQVQKRIHLKRSRHCQKITGFLYAIKAWTLIKILLLLGKMLDGSGPIQGHWLLALIQAFVRLPYYPGPSDCDPLCLLPHDVLRKHYFQHPALSFGLLLCLEQQARRLHQRRYFENYRFVRKFAHLLCPNDWAPKLLKSHFIHPSPLPNFHLRLGYLQDHPPLRRREHL